MGVLRLVSGQFHGFVAAPCRVLTTFDRGPTGGLWLQILDQLCLRFAAPKFNPLGFFGGEASPKMHGKNHKKSGFRNVSHFAHMAFCCALFGMVK